MLGQITESKTLSPPKKKKKLDKRIKNIYDTKLMQWLTIIDFF